MRLTEADKQSYFALHACCIPVKGMTRSIMYDLNRKDYQYIPNAMTDLLHANKHRTIAELLNDVGEADKETAVEYFEFLLEHEFIFLCPRNDLNRFPPISHRFETPSLITNAVVDLSLASAYDPESVFIQLAELGCRDIQIRTFDACELLFYSRLLDSAQEKGFKSIELLACYHPSLLPDKLIRFVNQYKFTAFILVHGAPFKRRIQDAVYEMHLIQFEPVQLEHGKAYRQTDCSYFSISPKILAEAMNHHLYFNRKVAIDHLGFVKNAESCTGHFGNVTTHLLKEIVEQTDFQRIWSARKDDTRVCKDCEYRYMCVDNRPIFWDEHNACWAHHEPCRYDPSRALWQHAGP